MALLKGHVQTWIKSSGQPLLENEITGVRGNLHREVCLLKRVRIWVTFDAAFGPSDRQLLVSSLGGQLVLRDSMSSDDELDRVIQVTRFNSFIFLSYGTGSRKPHMPMTELNLVIFSRQFYNWRQSDRLP